MNRLICIPALFLILLSCRIEKQFFPKTLFEDKETRVIASVLTDTLLPWKASDSLDFSIRAIEVDGDHIWFAGSNGSYGRFSIKDSSLVTNRFFETKKEDYALRSLAKTKDAFFVLTIGNPAKLIKCDLGSLAPKIVYEEDHPKVFYDSMVFWNEQEGIAIGDPTEGCMSIIITRNGGESWTKIPCDILPAAKEGEAAFAASDTNIAVFGNKTWIATGGKASRILFSPDKGKTWEIFETPIIQGKETTGLYSIDFYDAQNGFGIGGDYTQPKQNKANKIRTADGGITWELVGQNENPGYRSCVQYRPSGKGTELVAVGFNGIDYSNDAGNTWRHLSDESFYTFRFLNDSIAFAAGKGKISKLIFKP
jgi:photosystem II stability/assembly factor-like uncharacterized protein